MSDEPKLAGIVVYKRDGGNLEGRWTHPNDPGKFGRDVVYDVAAGQTTGSWRVDIYLPDQTEAFFRGQLDITAADQALLLKWTGTGGGKPMTFTGIGLCLDPDTIAATFQEA